MTCQKIPYPDKTAAKAAIRMVKINYRWRSKQLGAARKSGRKLRIYTCRWCGQWHLTTQSRRKK